MWVQMDIIPCLRNPDRPLPKDLYLAGPGVKDEGHFLPEVILRRVGLGNRRGNSAQEYLLNGCMNE